MLGVLLLFGTQPPNPQNKMILIYSDEFLKHNKIRHPENKERLIAIKNALDKKGYKTVEPVDVKIEGIENVHTIGYLNFLKSTSRHSGWIDTDTYFVSESYNVAVKAVMASVNAAENALYKKDSFALVRPPGHHACPNKGMGFCLLNNISIAANHLTEKGVKKVLILDIDCHHGNGTQEIFYKRSDVYYISLHQYPFYPGTGSENEIGEREGINFTKNIPLDMHTDDNTYLKKLEIFREIAIKFSPEVILVSMGYDTYIDDPLTMMDITIEGYYRIAKFIKDTAKEIGVGVAFFLEGGYNLKGLPLCVLETIKAFE